MVVKNGRKYLKRSGPSGSAQNPPELANLQGRQLAAGWAHVRQQRWMQAAMSAIVQPAPGQSETKGTEKMARRPTGQAVKPSRKLGGKPFRMPRMQEAATGRINGMVMRAAGIPTAAIMPKATKAKPKRRA